MSVLKIKIDISYPGLSLAERARLRDHLMRFIEGDITNRCCQFVLDKPQDRSDFIRSQNLDVDVIAEITPMKVQAQE